MIGNQQPQTTRIRFWQGLEADIDLVAIRRAAVPVKGISCENPLRFLEIYSNLEATEENAQRWWGWTEIERQFFPVIPTVTVRLGRHVPQPPFAWQDASPEHLCVSFTYNTNAILRILIMLCEMERIPQARVQSLLDEACQILAKIYRAREYFVIRNMNNNFNMFLISKVIEFLVGKGIYDSECQELERTRASLAVALKICEEQEQLSLQDKIAVALGRGVSFLESKLKSGRLDKRDLLSAQDISHRYSGTTLAIDHRDRFFAMISNGCEHNGRFVLAVVFDDATETADDLLWLLSLLEEFPCLEITLLVNTAQISINFSHHMLDEVLRANAFRCMVHQVQERLNVITVYCPFISFQTNYLPQEAHDAIGAADAVYIKGANFFETCQIRDKHTFYGFVVYGPISRAYSGLNDFDAVFAHVPPGSTGYIHGGKMGSITTLRQICEPPGIQ